MVRDPVGAARYEELALPPETILATVPPPERASRQALLATVDQYYSRMERRDSSGGLDFLSADCERLEHANSAGLGCRSQFEAGFVPFVSRVRDRRYLVVDDERQTVFALALLDLDGARRTPGDGTTPPVAPYFSVPRTLQSAEIFRFERGKIRFIETTLAEYPYGTPPVSAAAAATVAASPGGARPEAVACDRECLTSVVARWLDALATRRRDGLFEAPGLRYTENGQAVPVGKGIWTTITAVNAQRRVAMDAASGTAGVLVGISEQDVPGALAARLRVQRGGIVEIEAMVVRQELVPPDGNTATLFAPRLREAFDPTRFALEWAAFDSGGSDDPALAMTSYAWVPSAEAAARERRQLVRDPVQGLTFDLTMTDVTGADRGRAAATGPFTVMSVSLTKVRDGKPVASQSLARALPFKSRSGWGP
jgi:hypothetical protein